MSAGLRTIAHPDPESLAADGAGRVLDVLAAAQRQRGTASVVLTGGSMGTAVLAAIAASPRRSEVDWSRVDVWWSDERFVAGDSPERNAVQAAEAVGGGLALNPDRVHPVGSADEFATAQDAAFDYRRELAAAADVASLFPGLPHVHEQDATVVGVEGSPKPPPRRVSMTLPMINAAERVWFLVAGADKAEAVAAVRAGAPLERTPGAGVRGARETLLLVTEDALGG
ncbi:MAG: 6-phosphogluconolactonase [Actinomycetota bacterium]